MLHVLAHVDAGSLAASCHDAGWIRWAEARLGPAADRSLATDARVLATVLASQDALAAAHALAWAFDDEAQVRAATSRDLAELGASDVADIDALAVAGAVGPAAEILRAAAELELPHMRALRELDVHARADERDALVAALAEALAEVSAAAPGLASARIALACPLPRRGRAWRGNVLVGVPGVAGAEASHVAWQAAHEATVLEVSDAGSFEAVESAALALLRSRARRVGLGREHGRWLATVDTTGLGAILDVDDRAC